MRRPLLDLRTGPGSGRCAGVLLVLAGMTGECEDEDGDCARFLRTVRLRAPLPVTRFVLEVDEDLEERVTGERGVDCCLRFRCGSGRQTGGTALVTDDEDEAWLLTLLLVSAGSDVR